MIEKVDQIESFDMNNNIRGITTSKNADRKEKERWIICTKRFNGGYVV